MFQHELQVALDRMSLDTAVRIAGEVAAHADWIEVGTSLIKRYGVDGVHRIVAAAGEVPVLADLKTVDDARSELTMAYDAGARSATILGLASPSTLQIGFEVAREFRREIVVDLMEIGEAGRTRIAAIAPADAVLAAHVPKDAQSGGPAPLTLLGSWSAGRRIALAGGITIRDLPSLAPLESVRVIVGSSITGVTHPGAAAREFRTALGQSVRT